MDNTMAVDAIAITTAIVAVSGYSGVVGVVPDPIAVTVSAVSWWSMFCAVWPATG